MRIVGLVLLIALVGLAMGEPGMFLDIPSAIIVIGFVVGGLIFARADMAAMFGAAVSAEATSAQLRAGARAWEQARQYAMAAGVIGTVIGVVIMLARLDDVGQLGPGAAIALLTILYGLVLGYAVCLPMQRRLEDRALQQEG